MKQKGFTLVELVIVIIIVGILSLVAIPVYKKYVEQVRLTEIKSVASYLRTSQDMYYLEHGHIYIPSADDGQINYNLPEFQLSTKQLKYVWWFFMLDSGDYYTISIKYKVPNKPYDAGFDDRLRLVVPKPGKSYVGTGGRRAPYYYQTVDGITTYFDY